MISWVLYHLEHPPSYCLCHVFGWVEWARVMLIRVLRAVFVVGP